MKACVHYYKIVSVEASSADHIWGQMNYAAECWNCTDSHCCLM